MYIYELHKRLKNKTVIAHTGHKDLIAADIPEIQNKLEQKLKEITKGNFKDYIILTGIAEKADSIITEISLKLNIEVLILCIGKEDMEILRQLKNEYSNSHITAFDLTGPGYINTTLTVNEMLSRQLVQYTDILIALWDGIYNSKKGGTSYTIDYLLNCTDPSLRKRKKTINLYQLVVSREKNRFPLGKYFNKFEINLPQAHKLTWVEITVSNGPSFWKPAIVEKVKDFFRKSFRNAGEIMGRFIIPLLLTILVFAFGIKGYLLLPVDANHPVRTWWNAFFNSANLITLNTSVFDRESNVYLDIARLFGGSLAVYAFGLAFYFALGYENFHRLKFFFFRLIGGNHSTIIGLNEMSFDIAVNLRKKSKIVLLHNNPDSHFVQKCKEHKIWLIKGNPYAAAALRKTYFETAQQVYAVTDNDEDNFRCIQEMDQLIANKEVKKNEAKWFVHLTGNHERSMLQEFIRSSNRTALTSFSIPENTARRLLTKFPVNRYNNAQQEKICVIIIGFTDIGEQIALTALQQGIYLKGTKLEIEIYYNEEEAITVKRFQKKYSWLFNQEQGKSADHENIVRWALDNNNQAIRFNGPGLEAVEPGAAEFSLNAFIIPSNIVSIYVCLQSGIKNASFLSFFLPKLSYQVMKRPDCDVAVFWFYNFPDRDEEVYLQKKINALAPNLLVECFGNYLYETTVRAIANETMDHLARQVALWYYFLYDYKGNNERNVPGADEVLEKLIIEQNKAGEFREALMERDYQKMQLTRVSIQKRIWYAASQDKDTGSKLNEAMSLCWKNLSETDREGNRQAADHTWVKLREAEVIWEFGNESMAFDQLLDFWTNEMKKKLAILEHRRWNMMKFLEGWHPFSGLAQEWKSNKEHLKKQKFHNLLIAYEELEEQEKEKDFHQIEGIPFFLILFARQKLNKWIDLNYRPLA